MGAFSVAIELMGASGTRPQRVEALVDTGATYTVVSARVLAALGIRPQRRHPFELAGGRIVEYNLAEARVRVDGQETTTWVVFGREQAGAIAHRRGAPPACDQTDEGASPLLGVYTLEGMGLAVDPVRRRLTPVPGLLKLAQQTPSLGGRLYAGSAGDAAPKERAL